MHRKGNPRRPAAWGSYQGQGCQDWGSRYSCCLLRLSCGVSEQQGGWGYHSVARKDAGHKSTLADETGRLTARTHLNTGREEKGQQESVMPYASKQRFQSDSPYHGRKAHIQYRPMLSSNKHKVSHIYSLEFFQ